MTEMCLESLLYSRTTGLCTSCTTCLILLAVLLVGLVSEHKLKGSELSPRKWKTCVQFPVFSERIQRHNSHSLISEDTLSISIWRCPCNYKVKSSAQERKKEQKEECRFMYKSTFSSTLVVGKFQDGKDLIVTAFTLKQWYTCKFQVENCMFCGYFIFSNTSNLINVYISKRIKQNQWQ